MTQAASPGEAENRPSHCLFCAIADGSAPATLVYRDDQLVAFTALEPEAPVHLILVPRLHIQSVDALNEEHMGLWMAMLRVAQRLARMSGIDVEGEGYQLLTHAGRHGTRAFPHLHVHLLNGER
ncbi:MAG TPA: HIT domain-containing protein [Chloroflexota bacterium]